MNNTISCAAEPIYSYALGIFLCIGGTISYIPQVYNIIKEKNHKGISEMTLFLLSSGAAALAANSFILNWYRFQCFSMCKSWWLCVANLLSLIQILIGFIMCLPLYLVFMRYKIASSNKRVIYDLRYLLLHLSFVLIMIIVGLAEKIEARNSKDFFMVTAWILGGLVSPVLSSIIWLPQLVKLARSKDPGSLSMLMLVIQTPGNLVIIAFQILYQQSVSTWITYCFIFLEQAAILVLLILYKYRAYKEQKLLESVGILEISSESESVVF